jgi:Terminase large subunit, T4likevirus-type, N-terminal
MAMPVATDLATALDPVLLARRAGIEPDDWQAAVLRSTSPRLLLNCSRQSGKSTTTAALSVHTALYLPDSLVLLLSPSLRQSGELFRKCLDCYRAAGRPAPADSETKLTLELANGSRIVSLPGSENTVRGFSGVRLLVVDEAARVEDELYHAVRPMLAVSGGRLVCLSTPAGERGWWHREWKDGGDDWARVEVPASQCPRIPASFLAEERRRLPRDVYEQEYECCFHAPLGAVFAYEDVEAALVDGEPLFDSLLQFGR